MNLLFFVEEDRTEVKIYPKWLKHLFPKLNFVAIPEDITTNSCRIVSSKGYPPPGGLIKELIEDIKQFDNIDHFFLCFDSESYTYQERFDEVQTKLDEAKIEVGIDSSIQTKFHIIIQHCCIETWALGNARLPNEYSSKGFKRLEEFQSFYDVLIDDPELMECCPSEKEELIQYCNSSTKTKHYFRNKASFHGAYIKEYFKNYGLKFENKL